MTEAQQEQAALYALGLLDADEAAAFEHEMSADAELRELVRELRDAAGSLPLAEEAYPVPSDLRARVLASLVEETSPGRRRNVVSFLAAALPWAALVALALNYFALQMRESKLRADLTALRDKAASTPAPAEALSEMTLCALEPTPAASALPRAAALWDPVHRKGLLRVEKLPPPARDKDYQLWVVEDGRKDAVSAGVVHVDADGKAGFAFQPEAAGDNRVVAFAISVEKAGGSPKNEGPIILLGKL